MPEKEVTDLLTICLDSAKSSDKKQKSSRGCPIK